MGVELLEYVILVDVGSEGLSDRMIFGQRTP